MKKIDIKVVEELGFDTKQSLWIVEWLSNKLNRKRVIKIKPEVSKYYVRFILKVIKDSRTSMLTWDKYVYTDRWSLVERLFLEDWFNNYRSSVSMYKDRQDQMKQDSNKKLGNISGLFDAFN